MLRIQTRMLFVPLASTVIQFMNLSFAFGLYTGPPEMIQSNFQKGVKFLRDLNDFSNVFLIDFLDFLIFLFELYILLRLSYTIFAQLIKKFPEFQTNTTVDFFSA